MHLERRGHAESKGLRGAGEAGKLRQPDIRVLGDDLEQLEGAIDGSDRVIHKVVLDWSRSGSPLRMQMAG